MLLVQLIQDMATQGVTPHDLLPHWASLTHGHGFDFGTLTGQIQAQLQGQQFETDVFKGARNTFGSFIKTGKLWVFLGGMAVGYVLRAVTTYG
jgi:hypothetical protein